MNRTAVAGPPQQREQRFDDRDDEHWARSRCVRGECDRDCEEYCWHDSARLPFGEELA